MPYFEIFQESSLVSLSVQSQTESIHEFSALTNLDTFELNQPNIDVMDFVPLAAHLRVLKWKGNTNILNLNQLDQLTSLLYLRCNSLLDEQAWNLPASLETLEFDSFESGRLDVYSPSGALKTLIALSSYSSLNITALPSSITKLSLNFVGLAQSVDLPSSLESFYLKIGTALDSFPRGLDSCPNLVSLQLVTTNPSTVSDFSDSIPSFTNNMKLASLSFAGFPFSNATLERLICSARPQTLKELSLGLRNQPILPGCISSFTRLKSYFQQLPGLNNPLPLLSSSLLESLRLFSFEIPRPNWSQFVSRFPNLVTLEFNTNQLGGTFPAELRQLSRLSSLALMQNQLNGTIPENFFWSLPNLKYFHSGSNLITGSLPWYGYQSMERLILQYNNFTSWQGIAGGAPNMQHIDLTGNAFLSSIPDDSHLGTLTALRTIRFNDLNALGGPLPAFWMNHQFATDIVLTNSGFVGTVPPFINAPRLRNLQLSSNLLCGPLPEFAKGTMMKAFFVDHNRLSGSIPSSWSSNLTIFFGLTLSNNKFNGTIPSQFITMRGLGLITSLALNENDFVGPMLNMSLLPSIQHLSLELTNIDLCASNPNLVVSISSCILTHTSISPCACASWYPSFCLIDACYAPSGQPVSLAPGWVPTSNDQCEAVPKRLSPSLVAPPPFLPPTTMSCPEPIPTSFICVNGQLVAPNNVYLPTLTFPPNSGTVQVNGNLTVDSTITFDGIGSTLVIDGCINSPDGIIIELDEETNSKPIVLITQNDGCPQSLIDINLKIEEPKSCKKTKAKTEGSTASQLIVYFEVDSSSCKTKWIILGSVLGAVAIITITLALVFTLNPKARALVRPYHKRAALN
jgi:hypothetical protein